MLILMLCIVLYHEILHQFVFFIAYGIPINGFAKNNIQITKAPLDRYQLNKSRVPQRYYQSVCYNVCAVCILDHMIDILHAKIRYLCL